MIPTADYAHSVAYLDRARLPAYVSFVEDASTRGVARDQKPPQRIYVRTSDGAVLKDVGPDKHAGHANAADSENPFSKRSFFDPTCYVPSSESQARWNGRAALRFVLQPTCDKDGGARELYAEPQTLRPIAVDGDFTDSAQPGMTVAIELRYVTVGEYTLPSSMHVHVVGQGWLFWVRERADVHYTGYEFYERPPDEQRAAPIRAENVPSSP